MTPQRYSKDESSLHGGGEMGDLIRAFDWATSLLGSPEHWPQSLRTAVSMMLGTSFGMYIAWGEAYIQLYNDGFRPILGSTKHPAALGLSSKETFAEGWHIIGPMFDSVMSGETIGNDDWMFALDRHGYLEECYFTYSYSPIREEGGGIGGVLVIVTETTERVLSERRLHSLRDLASHTEQKLVVEDVCRDAIETLKQNPADIPFAYLYLVEDEHYTLVGQTEVIPNSLLSDDLVKNGENPSWLQTILQTNEAILIDTVGEHFDHISRSLWPEPIDQVFALPIKQTGQEHPFALLVVGISPRRAFDDNYRNFLTLVGSQIETAISKARTYEGERKRAEALAELDRAKTEFFSNISHEFRTPLTLMLSPLQDMLEGGLGRITDSQRESLELARRNSLRLLKLVNSLLDFSRIQANRIEASFEPTDLAALTVDLASNFRSAIENAGLKFVVDIETLPDRVYVDHEMWEKIVVNLLFNAFKFTFEGEIGVSLRASDDSAILTIRDTGIGISEDNLGQIFSRFHRVQGAHSRTHEGSGIGLALVAELVRFHGGHIAVDSVFGVGTSFIVTIPVGAAHLPSEHIRSSPLSAASMQNDLDYVRENLQLLAGEELGNHGYTEYDRVPNLDTGKLVSHTEVTPSDQRILVVDDNADMRDYLVRLLKGLYQVETAKDGRAALALIESQAPDLVIADVMMPHLDGFGLLRQLRASGSTIPLILLSARAGGEARIEGLQAGADDYLTKPFAARELLASIRSQLQLARLRKEVAQQERKAHIAVENIINSITDPFYALDRDWHFTYVNARLRNIWGKTSKELIHQNIWEVFPPNSENLKRVKNTLEIAVSQQEPQMFETDLDYNNQQWEVNVYPSSTGVAVYFRDITERKRSEQLRQRLELVMDNLHSGFVILDQNLRYIYANREAAEMANRANGTTYEMLMDSTLEQNFPEIASSHVVHELKRSLVQQVPTVSETYLEPYDLWIEYRSYPSLDDLAVFVNDITQRKHHEQQFAELLREQDFQRERLANIIATVPGVIFEQQYEIETRTMTPVFISAYFEEMFGYRVEDVLAAPDFWQTFLHPDDIQKTIDTFYHFIQNARSDVISFRALHQDGHIVDVDAHMILVYHDGQLTGLRGVLMDVSERERLLKTQARYARMLRRSNEELQQFAYVASHDLKAPLRQVTSYVQLLEKRYAEKLDDDGRDFLQFAVDGTTHMKEIIDALLAYSRIDQDEHAIQEIDVQQALDGAIRNLSLQIEDNQARITYDKMPRIKADRIQIMQLFQNLISNAITYRREDPPHIHITVEHTNAEWQFAVRDNGIGIAPDAFERIFRIFQRLHTNEEISGTGIGLAICKKVVERHNGKIWVESTLGQGTIFYFTLPR